MNDTISKYNSEITYLKGHLDSNKTSFNAGMESLLDEKDAVIMRVRKELGEKDFGLREVEDENGRLQEIIKKLRRELGEGEFVRQELENTQRILSEKGNYADRLKQEAAVFEEEADRLKREGTYLKESNQKLNYELIARDDEIANLNLEFNTINIRTKEQVEVRFRDEVDDRERQFSKLNSELMSMRSTLTVLEDDKNYQEENYRRANS